MNALGQDHALLSSEVEAARMKARLPTWRFLGKSYRIGCKERGLDSGGLRNFTKTWLLRL